MSDYQTRNDGKLHTRYSELVRCTPGQVMRVARERLGLLSRYEGSEMAFGTVRHEMWEDESKLTGRTPACFQEVGIDDAVENVEREWATEIFDGVVLHSRTDSTSLELQTINDNKTTVERLLKDGTYTLKGTAEPFAKKMQLKVYAYQIMMHNLTVARGRILAEVWSRDKTIPLGYDVATVEYTLRDFVEAREWLRERAQNLVVALELVKQEQKTLDNSRIISYD